MIITPYQILAPLACFVAIAYAWNLVFRQNKTIWEALLWSVFWGAIAAIAIFPDSVTYLSTVTGIQDSQNAVLVTFLGILLFLVFYIIIRIEALEQRQNRIIRNVALRDAGLEEEKKDDHRA